jgi:hypothetical protein
MKGTARYLVACVVTLSLLGVSASEAFAAPTLDQQSAIGAGACFILDTGFAEQQQVTAGMTGLLTFVQVQMYGTGTSTFSINMGPAWQADAAEFSAPLTTTGDGWYTINTSAAGIYLDPGDTFVIAIAYGSGTVNPAMYVTSVPDDGYAGGSLWVNGLDAYVVTAMVMDLTFKTFVDPDFTAPATVPVPGALLLAGIGTTLVAARRTRKGL